MLTIKRPSFVSTILMDQGVWLRVSVFAVALVLAGCAAFQPPSPGGPRGNEPAYPIVLTEDAHRKESIAVALKRLTAQTQNSVPTEAQLQPLAPTILNITPGANSSLYLPKVGASAVMSEEETRESLRRFIKEWRELIGADPAKLSLVERIDQPDGSKLANYEQRPFRYPIRGNYGKLRIRFTDDRRVLNLTSSCIPDADRMQSALNAINVRLKAEDVVQQLRQNGLAFTDAKGTKVNFTVSAASEITPLGLVIYIKPANDNPAALEFYLAWEVGLTNVPIKTAYIDAVNGDIIAAA